jgi:hypothetical protein
VSTSSTSAAGPVGDQTIPTPASYASSTGSGCGPTTGATPPRSSGTHRRGPDRLRRRHGDPALLLHLESHRRPPGAARSRRPDPGHHRHSRRTDDSGACRDQYRADGQRQRHQARTAPAPGPAGAPARYLDSASRTELGTGRVSRSGAARVHRVLRDGRPSAARSLNKRYHLSPTRWKGS